MTVDGWVIDATRFMELHPGGEHVLQEYIGKDASKAFVDPNIHVHSKAARDLLIKFQIGYLAGTKTADEISRAEKEQKGPSDFNVDISKGLLWQMAFIGDKYMDFIHETLIIQSEALRYFDNPVLEFFSRSPWWSVPLIWLPVTFMIFYNAVQAGLSVFLLPLFIVAAPFVWNFFEYFIHKHLFHMVPTTDFSRVMHFMLHGYHHIAPMDRTRLTFPAVPALAVGLGIYSTFAWILPRHIGLGLLGSVGLGYVFYDLMHYYLHHASPDTLLSVFSELKTHHLYHHYKNNNSNFGITMPIFDWLMGTYDTTMLKERGKKKVA